MEDKTVYIGKAGNGRTVHVVSVLQRDGQFIYSIYCGSEQFNGSGNGKARKISKGHTGLVTCKKCLKQLGGK